MDTPHRTLTEAGAALLVVGSLAQYLPPIASALGIVWYLVCLWESRTMKGLRKRARAATANPEDQLLAIWLGLAGCGVAGALVALKIIFGN